MKYLIFIGIFTFGFLSGMGVLYYFGDKTLKSGNKQKSNQKETYSLLMSDYNDKDENSTSNFKKEKKLKGENNKSDQNGIDSLEENNEEFNEADTLEMSSDTLNVEDEFPSDEDTLLTTELEIEKDEEGVIVKKEKITHSKRYKIKNLDKEENSKVVDSLIEKSMGVKKVPKNEIWVEFWESPLSSKGYIYRNLKVKLYGIDPQLSIDFYYKDDQLYLETDADLFHIKPTDEFQKFIFVSKDILKD